MDFSYELQDKLGKHSPTEIEELILDDLYQNLGTLTLDHKKALEQYSSLIHLSLKSLGIDSLTNFPSLPSLQILEVSNNKLTGSDFHIIAQLYPCLYKLKVSHNRIESIDYLNALAKTHLIKLEIEDNPFAIKMPHYNAAIFKMLPELRILDKHDAKGQEIDTTNYDEEEEEDISGDEEDEEFDEAEEEDEEEIEENDDGDEISQRETRRKKKKN